MTQSEPHWTTYDDRVVTMGDMTHQHMSNIHYYINNIFPEFYNYETREYIKQWLSKRFGGVILPYRPLPEFQFEKCRLITKGYLQENGDVVVDGQKIGAYE